MIGFDTISRMLPQIRVGLGYDSHRLGDGGPLRIGGIDVPAAVHSIGHSDADVLLHAITDSLLGAAGEPDIGRLFPDNADENAGRDSADFLSEALRRIRRSEWAIINLDAVILAQRPKMSSHIDAMRIRIADICDIEPGLVGLKAKTGEEVGEIGTGQSIAARCVVLLGRNS